MCSAPLLCAAALKLPPKIPVEFVPPLALFVDFRLALFLAGLFPLLIFRPGFAQHTGKPAAYIPAALPRRRIATRYDKTVLSFESFLNLAATRLWLKSFVNAA